MLQAATNFTLHASGLEPATPLETGNFRNEGAQGSFAAGLEPASNFTGDGWGMDDAGPFSGLEAATLFSPAVSGLDSLARDFSGSTSGLEPGSDFRPLFSGLEPPSVFPGPTCGLEPESSFAGDASGLKSASDFTRLDSGLEDARDSGLNAARSFSLAAEPPGEKLEKEL